jgi:hypothetical protein
LYHFQTKRYGAHKAADQLYSQLITLIDQFFEVYQGKHKKIPSLNGSILITTNKDKDFVAYTKKNIILLENATRKCCKVRQNSDFCNILDEIRAAMAQFIYLMTFK